MDEVLAGLLRGAVTDHLDRVARLAVDGDERSRASLASTEIPRLTSAWRHLLQEHQPDAKGHCRSCSRWLRPHRFPCSVWGTAHSVLIAAEPDPSTTTSRAAATAAEPGAVPAPC